ncbi:LemA family protein [Candidatus Bipolaricaulota bacterium]|nr:LemA family protein [Candidatus Bipolaricaulota bacterium]
MGAGYIVLLVVVFILGWGVLSYNRLIRLKVRSEESWRDIDTQLKRRYDLIPNLVETVKGYASHEKGVFEQVTLARAKAINASSPKEQAIAEEGLRGALKSLFAVVENYPQLKANENFLGLQQTLEQVEDAVQRSRVYYNAVVRDLNTRINIFPQNIIANLFGFKQREFYMLPGEEQREAPAVRF